MAHRNLNTGRFRLGEKIDPGNYRLHIRTSITLMKALRRQAEAEGPDLASVARKHLQRSVLWDGYLGNRGAAPCCAECGWPVFFESEKEIRTERRTYRLDPNQITLFGGEG